MNSLNVARSLNFFSNSLATSDQAALTELVEEYFTVNHDEVNDGKPIKHNYIH